MSIINMCLVCSTFKNIFSEVNIQHLLKEEPTIYRAVQCRRRDMLHLLLAKFNANPDAKWDGSTPLMLAVEMRDLKTVNLLLTHGADVEFHNIYGETALSIAIEQGSEQIIERLLKCSDINVNGPGPMVRTPLLVALDYHQFHIFQVLINDTRLQINMFIEESDNPGRTILHWAVRQRESFAVRMLLDKPHLDINLRDLRGDNALLLNVKEHKRGDNTRLQIADYLMRHSDIDINFQDREGRSALWHAVSSDCQKMVLAILEHEETDINLNDHEGITPLTRAVEYGNLDIVRILLQQPGCLRSSSSVSPLLWSACRAGHYSMVDYLLKQRSIDMNQPGPNGTSPLQAALSMRKTIIAHLLLDQKHKIRINHQDRSGLTALMQAAGGGYDGIVKRMLQDFDVDVNAIDHSRKTALCYAIHGSYGKTVRMLTRCMEDTTRKEPDIECDRGSLISLLPRRSSRLKEMRHMST
ncbi:hypothetical protein N7466_011132 [Penicillium verhagenii]|uniref:uncharacterized protein n=1 Tax=Penicillium verhagenii TaxID=1562060 RepID=UPI002545A90B|nr:uncharacterized protein N7466_011132 [Penicillium verhagenii]KAJ5917578.1 hypothetical protein N7466_011132 [Penicillium verhagenii]